MLIVLKVVQILILVAAQLVVILKAGILLTIIKVIVPRAPAVQAHTFTDIEVQTVVLV